ncbi:TRADD-N-associated membrane domain-containing protein [Paenibacillus amylolyticus]|uniref:TRADD-N-associated membrane domain-containing protein n=1 Tax=Paenibacillus amylolyticus TaxID=1451 RepID=UPI003D973671
MSLQLPDFSFTIAGASILAITIYTTFRRKNELEKFDNQIEQIAKIVSLNKEENNEVIITPKASTDSEEAIKTLQQNFSQLKSEIKNNKNTWSLVEGLIENYHKQALRQASIQFWFSALAAALGLGFIIMSLLYSESTSAYEKVVGTIPGLTVDAIAILFFKQAEQTRQRATELYDRLRLDKEREEAIKLIEAIADPSLKSIVKAQLALKIGGVDVTLQDLSNVVSSESS